MIELVVSITLPASRTGQVTQVLASGQLASAPESFR